MGETSASQALNQALTANAHRHAYAGFILASGSPARAALLSQIGVVPNMIVPPDIDEQAVARAHVGVARQVEAVAKAKATKVALHYPGQVVVAADTMVVVGRRVMGKPHDETEALSMLKLVTGRSHRVYSAVCVARSGVIDHDPYVGSSVHGVHAHTNGGTGAHDDPKTPTKKKGQARLKEGELILRVRIVQTRVRMQRCTPRDFKVLMNSGQWQGSAGGYRLQGVAGMFVDRVIGDPSGVMGLPLSTTMRLLGAFGIYPIAQSGLHGIHDAHDTHDAQMVTQRDGGSLSQRSQFKGIKS